MRIVMLGQAAFAEKVLQSLSDKGENVVGVYTPPDKSGRTNPMKELAKRLDIPIFQPLKMRTSEVFKQYARLKPDLNVMAYVTDIIPESILDYPVLGTIQYHPSLLPRHRGGSAINWAIINGETKTGITIFWPDKWIDTGPILLQKEVAIAPDDTVGSLYFNKLFPLGIEALLESIELVKHGKAPRIPQDESQASYEGICTEKEAIINWANPATTIYNLIRGTNPQPGAVTRFHHKMFKIFDSELLKETTDISPGEVSQITKQGFTVATANGLILVKRVQMADSAKISSSEFVKQVNLRAGSKLGY
jgi:methionyl-tRNA formyltransferase